MEEEPVPDLTNREIELLVDKLYEASDKAAFFIMDQMVERIRINKDPQLED